MNKTDFRAICAALGTLAFVIKDNVADEDMDRRALKVGNLIESLSRKMVPDALSGDEPHESIEYLLGCYISDLETDGSSVLDFHRDTLLLMYELLHVYKLRDDQKEYYASASEDMIANRVLQMTDEHIRRKEAKSRGETP